MYFNTLVSMGHFGTKKQKVFSRVVRAKDVVNAYEIAKHMPRVKQVISVTAVENVKEFVDLILRELRNDYLNTPFIPSSTVYHLIEESLNI